MKFAHMRQDHRNRDLPGCNGGRPGQVILTNLNEIEIWLGTRQPNL